MIKKTVRPVMTAYTRALKSQFSRQMLRLSIFPVILSVLLWGTVLYFGFEPLKELIGGWLPAPAADGSGGWWSKYGAGTLKIIAVSVIAVMLTIPMMVFTAMTFMGIVSMPSIVKHVSERQFPKLEEKRGGSIAGSVQVNVMTILKFLPLWLLTLPLYIIPPLALLVQIVLWGRVTSTVMCYDALADHASADERKTILRQHKKELTLIGILSGAIGSLPGIVWIGGTLISAVLFPVLAVIAVWIYVLIFIFTGLWFLYYCLQALEDLRAGGAVEAGVAHTAQ